MRNRLNPDGAKIRVLRVQRGWTQEQLAEIAGVSSRTVQRAETAESASFETLRAIAGAFESDFDQLLKNEVHREYAPEPKSTKCESIAESEPIPPDPGNPQVRRVWTMPSLLVGTLLLGLTSGA